MNGTSPCVSVIIPCYNAAAYFAEALDSVFIQQVPSLEVIVIDDGSTDATKTIAASYGSKLRYAYQENQGISGARNTGLAMATGENIIVFDHDDLWLPDTLATLLAYLRAEPSCGGAYGQVECFISPELPQSVKDRLACPQTPLAGRMAGAMLVRREIFERVGGFDTGLQAGETMDWAARAEHLGVRLDAIESVVLRRRLHTTNTSLRTRDLHSNYLTALRSAIARRRSQTHAS